MEYAVEMASRGMISTFHEDWYRRSSKSKVLPQTFRGCNVGMPITVAE
jgi:hypothetical protein